MPKDNNIGVAMATIASSLRLIGRRIPLDPADRVVFNVALESLEALSEQVGSPSVDKTALSDVVKGMLPDMIGGIVERTTRQTTKKAKS